MVELAATIMSYTTNDYLHNPTASLLLPKPTNASALHPLEHHYFPRSYPHLYHQNPTTEYALLQILHKATLPSHPSQKTDNQSTSA